VPEVGLKSEAQDTERKERVWGFGSNDLPSVDNELAVNLSVPETAMVVPFKQRGQGAHSSTMQHHPILEKSAGLVPFLLDALTTPLNLPMAVCRGNLLKGLQHIQKDQHRPTTTRSMPAIKGSSHKTVATCIGGLEPSTK